MAGLSPQVRELLEKWSVRLSFWLGGVSIVCIKCLAFWLSGSGLVKASMFESLGDIISSAIMAVTQMRVRDKADMHLYPTGKRRLAPLGILFFAAFVVSTMTGLIVSNLSALFESGDEESSSATLRRLFDEQPRLRRGFRPAEIEVLIARYGEVADSGDDSTRLIMYLLTFCIFIKAALLALCLYTARQTGSEIARALSMDHRNDVCGNSMVVAVVVGSSWLRNTGRDGPWLDKVDPASSLLLSAFIFWSWMSTASEQLTVLSNRRADEELVEGVTALVEAELNGSHFKLVQAETYHIGDGYAAMLDIVPQANSSLSPARVADAIHSLEKTLLASGQVHDVHTRLRPAQEAGLATSGGQRDTADMSWIREYQT
eukprot:TRINITY_DN30150_c0_g1_i1.p1 TRINITY_DN30150_c0_g1~~TRINITY_DN30150_c0_g1_i1.p1  ORF type:complete len:402 (-),score=58.28 TRINITY_DN30150_c0_g1_i1:168-1286(-)